MIGLLLTSMLYAIWEGSFGTPAQTVISILLSIITLGGTLAVQQIMSKLGSISQRVIEIERSQEVMGLAFARIEQNHTDISRRVEGLEQSRDLRNKLCSSHGEDIARLKAQIERRDR